MTTHKRKASQQLTSNTISIVEPTSASPEAMSNLFLSASGAAIWLTKFISRWFIRPPPFTTMEYGSADIDADNHIQSSQTRDDGVVSIKRQRKLRSTSSLSRSRSAVFEPRYSGSDKLDLTGCDENEVHASIDAVWHPPELRLMKKKPVVQAEKIVIQDQPDRRQIEQKQMRRRNSGPASFSKTQVLRSRTNGHISSLCETPPLGIRECEPASPVALRKSVQGDGGNIEQQLAKLLILDIVDCKANRTLTPSNYVDGRRKKRAEELAVEQEAIAKLKAKELRISRRKPLRVLVPPLSPRWERAVQDAELRDNDHNRVITTSIGGTELRLKDFQTLLGLRSWLNDEIINTYIEWLVDAANKSAAVLADSANGSCSKIPKFIAHNSFFYESVTSKGPSSTQRLMSRKKAPGVSLMEVDSVLIPICRGSHWTLGVVRPVVKTIEYFDSLGGNPQNFLHHIRAWLHFQLGKDYVEDEWRVPKTPSARQHNGYDCGVFVCTNAFCVVLGLETSCYTELDMELQRRNIAAVLINRGFTGDFDLETSGL